MIFVPDSAEFVSYVEYRAVFEATGNYSLFGIDPVVEIYSPPHIVMPDSVEYELTVTLRGQTSEESVPTVNVLRIDLDELRRLGDALANSSVARKTTHGDHTIYTLLVRRRELKTPLVLANVVIAHDHVLMTQGVASLAPLVETLDTADHGQNQFFSQPSARSALYASGGADGGYAALFVATFPTQIEGAKMEMKTIKAASEDVTSQIALSFDSQEQARSKYSDVKQLYTGGKDYWIEGPFVVAVFQYDITRLADQVRGL
jgi:hypothetical protein